MTEIDLKPYIEEIARRIVKEEFAGMEERIKKHIVGDLANQIQVRGSLRRHDGFPIVGEPGPEAISFPPGTSILPPDKS